MTLVTAARKISMLAYYNLKKNDINRNRMVQAIRSGKQKGMQRKTYLKYENEFSQEERVFLASRINEKIVKHKKGVVLNEDPVDALSDEEPLGTQEDDLDEVDTRQEKNVFGKQLFRQAIDNDNIIKAGTKRQ